MLQKRDTKKGIIVTKNKAVSYEEFIDTLEDQKLVTLYILAYTLKNIPFFKLTELIKPYKNRYQKSSDKSG